MLGLAAIAVTALTAALVATSDVLDTPTMSAAVRASTVAAWILCGLWTWDRRPESRLGPVMVVGGFAYSLGLLNAIDAPAPFTVGSVLWVAGAYLVTFTALVFPGGRLPDRTARVAAIAIAGVSGVLWTLLLLGADTMPTTAKPFHCEAGCPPNPFDVIGFSSGTTDVLSRFAFGLYGIASLIIIVILVGRIRSTSPAVRRTLMPPTACLCIVAAAYLLSFVLGRSVGDDGFTGWVPSVTAVAFPLTLLLGQARGRLFAAGSLRDMVRRLSLDPNPGNLESLMAGGLGDPTLRLAFPVGGGTFVDGTGRSIAVPGDSRASVTEIRDGAEVTAAIMHDPALDEPAGMVEAAGAAIQLALDNARLEADVRASARELRESRARMLTAGVAERRRLERDLHDTAQQRLVALRIKFALAEERADGELGELLDELGADVEETIDSVRVVGRGLYPPLLADQGLGAALTSSLGRASDDVSLSVGSLGRSDQNVEAAVYLCCRAIIDALTRTPTANARVALVAEDGDLRISVAADRREPPGWVMTQMHDHVGSLGGRVSYTADEGGWHVDGYVPWPRTSR